MIGITGTIGSGKGMLAAYLVTKGFRHVSVSDFLLREASQRRMPVNRITSRIIGNEYRSKNPTGLIEAVLEEADVNFATPVVVESLHTVSEVGYMQQYGKVIAIDAPLELRYKRIEERGDQKDALPEDIRIAEEQRETVSENPNENNLLRAMQVADYHILNTGSIDSLQSSVDGILGYIL